MSLERPDRGTTLETTEQPKGETPPEDNPGTPGYPSRRESHAIARGETSSEQAESEPAPEQKPSGERGESKRDNPSGRDEQEDRQDNSSESRDPADAEQSSSSTGEPSESSTPRLDSHRAYARHFEQRTDSGAHDTGTSPQPDGRTEGPRETSELPQDSTDPAPVLESREPDAQENSPEAAAGSPDTSDDAPRPGTENAQPVQDAGEPSTSPREVEPAPEETREDDGSWDAPQEQAEVTDDERAPLVPEQQAEGDGSREAERDETTEHGEGADEPPKEPTDQGAPANDGTEPDQDSTEQSTEPAEPQAPAPHEDSRFAGSHAYVGEDGQVKWLLTEDLELQGEGYEGPRSADQGDPLSPVDEETDLGRDPENPKRLGDALRALNKSPDDAQKNLDSTLPKIERSIDKPPTGHPSVGKDTRQEMESPMQAKAGSTMIAAAAVILVAIRVGQMVKSRFGKG